MVSQGLGFAAAGAPAEWLPVPVAIALLAATGVAVVLLAGRRLPRSVPPRRRRLMPDGEHR